MTSDAILLVLVCTGIHDGRNSVACFSLFGTMHVENWARARKTSTLDGMMNGGNGKSAVYSGDVI